MHDERPSGARGLGWFISAIRRDRWVMAILVALALFVVATFLMRSP
jgi:hypothetical protein